MVAFIAQLFTKRLSTGVQLICLSVWGGGMEELCTFAGVGVYSKPLEKAGEECLEDVAILLLASFDCMFSPPSS